MAIVPTSSSSHAARIGNLHLDLGAFRAHITSFGELDGSVWLFTGPVLLSCVNSLAHQHELATMTTRHLHWKLEKAPWRWPKMKRRYDCTTVMYLLQAAAGDDPMPYAQLANVAGKLGFDTLPLHRPTKQIVVSGSAEQEDIMEAFRAQGRELKKAKTTIQDLVMRIDGLDADGGQRQIAPLPVLDRNGRVTGKGDIELWTARNTGHVSASSLLQILRVDATYGVVLRAERRGGVAHYWAGRARVSRGALSRTSHRAHFLASAPMTPFVIPPRLGSPGPGTLT